MYVCVYVSMNVYVYVYLFVREFVCVSDMFMCSLCVCDWFCLMLMFMFMFLFCLCLCLFTTRLPRGMVQPLHGHAQTESACDYQAEWNSSVTRKLSFLAGFALRLSTSEFCDTFCPRARARNPLAFRRPFLSIMLDSRFFSHMA